MKRALVRRRFARLSRLVASALVAVCLVVTVPAPTAAAADPSRLQRVVWNAVCVYVAKGEVSPQVALVCAHHGVPIWETRSLKVLQVVCERFLHGSYVYRSEYPTELAACFFD